MSKIVRMEGLDVTLWTNDQGEVITQIWVTQEQFELIIKTYNLQPMRGAPCDTAYMGFVVFCVHVTPEELGLEP